MAKLPGVSRPQPRSTEAELALSRARTEARLNDLFTHRGDRSPGDPRSSPTRRPPIEVRWAAELIGVPDPSDAAPDAPEAALDIAADPADAPEAALDIAADPADAPEAATSAGLADAGGQVNRARSIDAAGGPAPVQSRAATAPVAETRSRVESEGSPVTEDDGLATAPLQSGDNVGRPIVDEMIPAAGVESGIQLRLDPEPLEAPMVAVGPGVPPARSDGLPGILEEPVFVAAEPSREVEGSDVAIPVGLALPAAISEDPAQAPPAPARRRAPKAGAASKPAPAGARTSKTADATKRAPARVPSGRHPGRVAAPAKAEAAKAAPAKAAPAKAQAAKAEMPRTVAPASCPYCARLLDPPPASSRLCPRCRQRIVVKSVDGRVVYLTEAAIAVFEAERRKAANAGRYARERQRWLKLAVAAGAPERRAARIGSAALSEEAVEGARQLYLGTVDSAFQAAKREQRWEDASRIRRDQAVALYRLAGSPVPPPEDVLALHREAVAAELRGLGKIVRDAELVGGECCAACRADAGGVFAIAKELAAPRLPHEGCPRGLCRCRWDLSNRDRELVLRYLRRRPRPGARAGSAGHEPRA
jgi:hypothetical protein